MVRQRLWPILVFLFLIIPASAHGQAWSGIIDPSRAIDWSSVGSGVVQTRTTICSTLGTAGQTASFSQSVTSAQINSAVAACPAGQVVYLSAGTYSLSSGVSFGGHSNVTVRGAGPTQTILKVTGNAGCGYSAAVCMGGSTRYSFGSSQILPGGTNACTWSSPYTKGETSVSLTACGSAPTVGQVLFFSQANDSSDTGGVYIYYTAGGNADGNTVSGAGYSEIEPQIVTAVSGSGSSYTVSIRPGIMANNFRSSQNPMVDWLPNMITSSGIENLTIDASSAGNQTLVNFYGAYKCWMKNVRSYYSTRNHIWMVFSAANVVRDSYFYQSANHAEESYGIESEAAGLNLYENNIFWYITSPFVTDGEAGTVYSYNFSANNEWSGGGGSNFQQGTYAAHNAGPHMNLWEGNQFNFFAADTVWGTASTQTLFRNRLDGYEQGTVGGAYPTLQTSAIYDEAWSRGFNFVGNVLGTAGYHTTYEASTSAGFSNANKAVYNLGCSSWNGSSCGASDGVVENTLLRWGNWDAGTNTVRWNASEIPTTATAYLSWSIGTGLPQTLPSSFYLSSKPSWWPSSSPFPANGPDVSGGNAANADGHANNIPAQVCFANTAADATYGLQFDANTCYGQSQSSAPPPPQPSPPTNLTVIVQ